MSTITNNEPRPVRIGSVDHLTTAGSITPHSLTLCGKSIFGTPSSPKSLTVCGDCEIQKALRGL